MSETSNAAHPVDHAAECILSALSAGALTDDARQSLQRSGLQDANRAYGNLRRLRDAIPAETFGRLMPPLLQSLAGSPDPDMALNNIERIVATGERAGELADIWTEAPHVLRTLVQLCAASQLLADILQEVEPQFSALILRTPAPERVSLDRLQAEVGHVVGVPGGTPARLSALRRLKRRPRRGLCPGGA
jgi:glutamate-ammonia-ligase adenylyltransferase